jgi:hypothetical protein
LSRGIPIFIFTGKDFMQERNTSNDYITNQQLQEEMIIYKDRYNKAKAEGLPPPPLTDFIGKCILQIANGLAEKSQFRNYTFINEMISDGIENCVRYLYNFDPVNYSNPFAYITQIAKFAFIRRIKDEAQEQYFKMKALQDFQLMEQLNDNSYYVENNDVASQFIKDYEDKLAEKKKKSPPKTKKKGKKSEQSTTTTNHRKLSEQLK